jgi:beta-lactamase class A
VSASDDLQSLAEQHAAVVSVWMGGLDGTAWLTRDVDRQHPAASTMKLPLLVALHRAHARGHLHLDTEVPVVTTTASVVPDATVTVTRDYDNDDQPWHRVGGTASLRWLGERAIVRSSNLATNLLLQHVGLDAVNEVWADAGAPRSRVCRGIQDTAAGSSWPTNVVTAHDLAAVLRALAGHRLLDASRSAEVEGVLAQVEHVDGVPAGLPAGTWCAHKPGWIETVCHDAALVRPGGEPPFVLVVLTQADLDEQTGHRLVADVARVCWCSRAELAKAAA